ncbi:MAG: DUF6308 family protein [Acidimicrobiia bacterium]
MPGLEGDVWPFLDGSATVELVSEYFGSGKESRSPFTGALFERFGGGGDAPGRRHSFDPADLVAVTLLGVEVPGRAALRILDEDAAVLNGFLQGIPDDVDLWEAAEDVIASGSEADKLWHHLVDLPGVGWVTAGKLLARKRPRLIPVYDQVVKDALMPPGKGFWAALHAELQNQQLVERLKEIRAAAGLDGRISLLRVLDVAVWMRNRGIEQVQRDRGGLAPIPFSRSRRN